MTIEQLEADVHSLMSDFDSPVGLVIKEGNDTININEDVPMPAASVIKIPIMMEAFRQAENGLLDLSQNMEIPTDAIVGGSGVLQFLSERVSMSLLDFLTLMIIVSDNTASNLALEQTGIENVNNLCRDLECHHTEVQRYFMDMKAAESGFENTTTAGDMVKFLEEIASPKLLTKKSAGHIFDIMTGQQLTSKLPAYHTANDVVIANKTGELAIAQHDVGIFKYQDKTVLAAVMTDRITDHIAIQQTIARIGKAIMSYLTK